MQWIETTVAKLQSQDYANVDSENIFTESYTQAVKQAKAETSLSLDTFPLICPYQLAQVTDDDFSPINNCIAKTSSSSPLINTNVLIFCLHLLALFVTNSNQKKSSSRLFYFPLSVATLVLNCR